eukprot:scaffold56036_cov62-Phaeocystis_antarctica.AAC.4
MGGSAVSDGASAAQEGRSAISAIRNSWTLGARLRGEASETNIPTRGQKGQLDAQPATHAPEHDPEIANFCSRRESGGRQVCALAGERQGSGVCWRSGRMAAKAERTRVANAAPAFDDLEMLGDC